MPPGEEGLAATVNVSQGEFVACMTDVMKDEKARRTLELSVGVFAADWADDVADLYLEAIASGRTETLVEAELVRRSGELGRLLCATVESLGRVAEDQAKAAIEALAGMRFGIDMGFKALGAGMGAVPGGPLAAGGAGWVVEQAEAPFDDYVSAMEETQWEIARTGTDSAHTMAGRIVGCDRRRPLAEGSRCPRG